MTLSAGGQSTKPHNGSALPAEPSNGIGMKR
jgi:hypothetical protein